MTATTPSPTTSSDTTTPTPQHVSELLTSPTTPEPRRLRCLPVPRSDPPFDDELLTDTASLASTAATAWWSAEPLDGGVPPRPPSIRAWPVPLPFPPPGALVEDNSAGYPSVEAHPGPEEQSPRDTSLNDIDDADDAEASWEEAERAALTLPDPQRWATQLTQAILEVLAGERPIVQLARWTSPPVYETLLAQTLQTRAAPGRARRRPVVRSVRVARPRLGVAEVTSTAVREGRLRAVALRLESTRAGWCCTALQLI